MRDIDSNGNGKAMSAGGDRHLEVAYAIGRHERAVPRHPVLWEQLGGAVALHAGDDVVQVVHQEQLLERLVLVSLRLFLRTPTRTTRETLLFSTQQMIIYAII